MEPDILKGLEPVKMHQLKFQLCIAQSNFFIQIKYYVLELFLVYLVNQKYIVLLSLLELVNVLPHKEVWNDVT